jgi:phage-related protein (TIGR01555 family)
MKTNDGAYRNLVTGLGDASADKSIHNEVARAKVMSPETLSDLYMADGIGTAIVDCIPDDALANGWEIVGDKNGELWNALGALQIPSLLHDAAVMTNLYGGAVMVVHTENGGVMDSPLLGNGAVRKVSVWSSGRVVLNQNDVVTDPASPYFDDVEVFTIRKRDNSTFRVHASRCVVFRRAKTPDCWIGAMPDTMYFGVSALQQVRSRLMGLGVAMQGVDNMLAEPDVGVYGIDGLSERLAEQDSGVKAISERIGVMHLSKSLLRSLVLDKNDTFAQIAHNFTGIPETIQKEMNMVAACAQIPVTRLFGEAASGLNATGKGDERNYNRKVAAFQSRTLAMPMSRLVSMVNARNCRGAVKGDNLEILFNPLETSTMAEMVEMRLKQAQTDDLNIRNQIYTPEEARVSRVVGGYSFETAVDGEV